MKKLYVVIMLLLMANSVMAYDSYSDYLRDRAIRDYYEQERFNRTMENNRRSSAANAMYYMQQNNTVLHNRHIPTTDYGYHSTQTNSKPLEVFGRY